jgi:hypothetical protein
VREASRAAGLSCKLTGAGGGGCAFTLLRPKAVSAPSAGLGTGLPPQSKPGCDTAALASATSAGLGTDKSTASIAGAEEAADTDEVDELRAALRELSFDTFFSSVGGDGVLYHSS